MADFTPIETQEQLDRIIGDRIRRAEAKAVEPYADYDALKQQVASLTDQISKQAETINGNQAVVDDLNAKIHQYETASVKTAVALELGIPYQMASRLTGDDEAAIRKDAEAMAKLIAPINTPAPLPSGGGAKTSTSEMFANAVSDFFNH